MKTMQNYDNLNFENLEEDEIISIKRELKLFDAIGKIEFKDIFMSSGFLSRTKTGKITFKPVTYK